MSSPAKRWVVVCVLAAFNLVALGCRESSPPTSTASSDTGPSGSGATSGQQSAPAEATAPPALTIGSPAPPLTIAQWVTGEPIDQFEPGQLYVVEFWATWCGPCRRSMPHISQLQQQYGPEVKFVGVTREPESTVREFLKEEQSPGKTWAEVVQYRLAVDSADATNEAYMKAAGQSGIPTAFLVGRDAAIEWIGHPGSIDDTLAKIAAGTWDRQAAVAEFQRKQKLKQLSREITVKFRAEEWDGALALIDRFEQENGPSPEVTRTRLSVFQKAGRAEEAAKLQAQWVEQSWGDAATLNEIAWGIAIGKRREDLALALKAAQHAAELTNNQDAAILDTLARVHYELGQLDQAIERQKKAAEQSPGDPSIGETLKRYEAEEALKSGELTAPAENDPAKPVDQDGAGQ